LFKQVKLAEQPQSEQQFSESSPSSHFPFPQTGLGIVVVVVVEVVVVDEVDDVVVEVVI